MSAIGCVTCSCVWPALRTLCAESALWCPPVAARVPRACEACRVLSLGVHVAREALGRDQIARQGSNQTSYSSFWSRAQGGQSLCWTIFFGYRTRDTARYSDISRSRAIWCDLARYSAVTDHYHQNFLRLRRAVMGKACAMWPPICDVQQTKAAAEKLSPPRHERRDAKSVPEIFILTPPTSTIA